MEEFKAPRSPSRVHPRKMLSCTPKTHKAVAHLALKHKLSMTLMLEAIVMYHERHIHKDREETIK